MAFPNTVSLPQRLEKISDDFSSLVELLRYRAQHQPDQVAYIFLKDGEVESGRLTYQELDRQAQAIAAKLQSMGAAGSQVLLTYPLSEGLAFTAAFFGCLYAGSVAVTAWPPLNNALLAELEFKAADAEVTFVLTTQPLLSRFQDKFSSISKLSELHWIATDELLGKATESWQQLFPEETSLAYFQYTSGSTGVPKGVMISHGNVLANLELLYQSCEYTAKDKGVCWLPLYHDMGLVGGVIQPVYVGAPVVMMSPVDFILKPFRWLQAISQYRATTSGGPNFAYELCIRKTTLKQRESLDLSCWKIATNGAEPVLAQTLERFTSTFGPCGFRREAFSPAYGMAETTVMVTSGMRKVLPLLQTVHNKALEQNYIESGISTEASESRTIVGCGQIGNAHRLKIVNPDTLTSCAANQVGEIWIAGPSVAQGYWNRAEETQKTFHAYVSDTGEGPFLRTGDMGFLQAGELFVTGRLKDVIMIWGRSHYPHHIEMTVEQSHSVLRPGCGAVFGLEVDGEEQLVVTQEVESRYLKTLDSGAVIEAIRQALVANHMVEAHAIVLLRPGSTPKTPTGKTQRAACRTQFLAGDLKILSQWQHSQSAAGIALDPSLVTSGI